MDMKLTRVWRVTHSYICRKGYGCFSDFLQSFQKECFGKSVYVGRGMGNEYDTGLCQTKDPFTGSFCLNRPVNGEYKIYNNGNFLATRENKNYCLKHGEQRYVTHEIYHGIEKDIQRKIYRFSVSSFIMRIVHSSAFFSNLNSGHRLWMKKFYSRFIVRKAGLRSVKRNSFETFIDLFDSNTNSVLDEKIFDLISLILTNRFFDEHRRQVNLKLLLKIQQKCFY